MYKGPEPFRRRPYFFISLLLPPSPSSPSPSTTFLLLLFSSFLFSLSISISDSLVLVLLVLPLPTALLSDRSISLYAIPPIISSTHQSTP
ncbi:hypothetical protein GGS23DRAFT_557509 [Durotheca rogersii]|uniref:uncharacterized protein n=1 Tax=Durotheca rogersii TaxID=419775 RepID=UPI00221F9985|nr:uncharacterized protein GGS23DRAFT_557509 [Durotheca rogersii]KAI5865056.1 hypothetical protein GGS23DRAFT_557509 [Durotheca rogersii]